MTLRHKLIGHYLPHYEIYEIIPHHGIVYAMTCGIYVGILTLLVISYRGITSYIQHPSINIMRAVLGVAVYIFFLADIADKYLDALVVTNMGLVHFTRDNIFKQTTVHLQRFSIESISEERNSFRDTILRKGDITLNLEDKEYVFKDLSAPAEQISTLLTRKEKIVGKAHYTETEAVAEVPVQSGLKNEILIEALSEVILEYIEKKK